MRKLLRWAIVASLLVAAVVVWESYALLLPKYESSAVVLVDTQFRSDGRPHPIPTTFVTPEQAQKWR